MKTILHERLRRVFPVLLLIASMLFVVIGEAKAWVVTYLDDGRFELDFGSVLILKAGTYGTGDPIGNPDDGVYYSTNQEMILEIPKGFRLDSLTINGIDYMSHDLMNPHTAKKYFDVRDSWPGSNPDPEVPGIWEVKATIVPDTITSPAILVGILNGYAPGSARQEGERVIVDKDQVAPEIAYPHVFDLKDSSLVIDGLEKTSLFLPGVEIVSGQVTISNLTWVTLSNEELAPAPFFTQIGGSLSVENTNISFNKQDSPFIEQKDGLFQVKNSNLFGGILLNGDGARVEFVSGKLDGNLVVESGDLEMKQGKVEECITMKGGSLRISGGFVDKIDVMADCDISLSGGFFYDGIIFHQGTNVPASSSLLADGYVYARDYLNMIFPLGKDLEVSEIEEGKGFAYFSIVPGTYVMEETAAYKAAKTADIGPDGKDIKVLNGGEIFDVYTPEGLCWIAVRNGLIDEDPFENGISYTLSKGKIRLKNDLDMTSYGDGWPGINLRGSNVLDGNGYRIYNMKIEGAGDACFVNENGGVMTNVIVEGNILLNKMNDNNIARGAFIMGNDGLVVNCAFIGSLFSDIKISGGRVRMAGLTIANYESGRIENSYVNLCGGRFGATHQAGYPPLYEGATGGTSRFEFTKLVDQNYGSMNNCYFVGDITFEGQEDAWTHVEKYDLVRYNNDGEYSSCYKDDEVAVETLNANVASHQQDDTYPWATWAVDPDKQCGKPYLVLTEDTAPTSNVCQLSGDLNYDLRYTEDYGWRYWDEENKKYVYFTDSVFGSTTGRVSIDILKGDTLVFTDCEMGELWITSNTDTLWVKGNITTNRVLGPVILTDGSIIQAPEGKGTIILDNPVEGGSYKAYAYGQEFQSGRRLPEGTKVWFEILPDEGYILDGALFGEKTMIQSPIEGLLSQLVTEGDNNVEVKVIFRKKVVLDVTEFTDTDTVTVTYSGEYNSWYYQEAGAENKIPFDGEVAGENDKVVLLVENVPMLQFAKNSSVGSLVVSEGSSLQVEGRVEVGSVSGNITASEPTTIVPSSEDVVPVETPGKVQSGGSYEVTAFDQPVDNCAKLPAGTVLSFEITIQEGYELESATIGGENLSETPSLLRTKSAPETVTRYYTIKGNEKDLMVNITFNEKTTDPGTDPDPDPDPTPDPDPDPDPDPTPDPEPTINLTLPAIEGATTTPAAGTYEIEEGEGFSFVIVLDEDYDQSKPIVKVNGKVLEPDSDGVYQLTRLSDDVTITIEGIVKNEEDPTSISGAEDNVTKVWASHGYLHIQSYEAGTAYIISMNGKLHKILTLPEGETVTSMPQGVYIVRVGGQSYKLRF